MTIRHGAPAARRMARRVGGGVQRHGDRARRHRAGSARFPPPRVRHDRLVRGAGPGRRGTLPRVRDARRAMGPPRGARRRRVRPLRGALLFSGSTGFRRALTALTFAVVGNFEDAVYCWRSQALAWSTRTQGVILAAGAGALGVRLGDTLHQYGSAAVPAGAGHRQRCRRRRHGKHGAPHLALAGAVDVPGAASSASRTRWGSGEGGRRLTLPDRVT